MKNQNSHIENTLPSYERKYRNCRALLLLLALFTVANAVLAMLEVNRYLLFGPALPYYLLLCGLIWGNRYSDAFYTDAEGNKFSFDIAEADGLFIAGLAVTAAFAIIFLILWILSKNRIVPMIVAASLYGADMIFLCVWSYFVFDFSISLRYAVLHGAVLAALIVGCVLGFKMRRRQKEPSRQQNILIL
jgi:hypothetical protein